MPRRGDNIRKRKDGRWEARYPKDDNNSTTSKYGSVYGRTYQEAKEKRERIIKEGVQKPSVKGILFSELLAAWQDSNRVRLKGASVSRYQMLIDTHILPELGNKVVNSISPVVINRFLSSKLTNGRLDGTGGLSSTYVRSIALVISSAISYGASEGLCSPLITPITKPSLIKQELCVLDLDAQKKLEEELLRETQEDKLLIYLTLYTGLRIGEACALCWEDIDFDARVIFVRKTVSRMWDFENGLKRSILKVDTPKTKSSLRSIPICSNLYAVLSSFPFKKRRGYILSSKNTFVSPRTFEYRYKKIMTNCGLIPVNYHCLRHTFATRCVECGVDIKSLSEILGHANASITLNTYVHSSLEMKRVQLEKIAS